MEDNGDGTGRSRMDAQDKSMRLPADPGALQANDRLNGTIALIYQRNPQSFDHKGNLVQNADNLAGFLADALIDMVGHVITMTHERYRVVSKYTNVPVQPKPDLPVRNMGSFRGWDNMSHAELTACRVMCRWRVSQIWFGANAQESLRDYEYVSNQLTELAIKHPQAFDSLVVGLCFNACVLANNKAGGNVPLFAMPERDRPWEEPSDTRGFLNQHSRLLDDPFAVYALTRTSYRGTGVRVFESATDSVRTDLNLNLAMVLMGGDSLLEKVNPEVYAGGGKSHVVNLIRTVRADHYANNPARKPYLAVWDAQKRPFQLLRQPGDRGLVDDSEEYGWIAPPELGLVQA